MAQEFVRPVIEEITSQISNLGGLRADSQQQQQQQQQQHRQQSIRRYLNLETSNPEEEVITKLTTEIKTLNRVIPREK